MYTANIIKVWLGACLLLWLSGCAMRQTSPPASEPSEPAASVPFFQQKAPQQSQAPRPADVLMHAIGLVGTPYRWGGNTPETGFDCSGLIRYVFQHSAQVDLPRTTGQMWQHKGKKVSRSQLQSGDVVFFATNGGRRVSHAGIYVGEGRFVHAPSSGGTVRLDSMKNPYWQRTYLSAKRFL